MSVKWAINWKRAAKRWRYIRNTERKLQINDYLRNRLRFMLLLRVALEAHRLSDTISEFGMPVNGTDDLDRALLAVYGLDYGDGWVDTKSRLRSQLRAMEYPRPGVVDAVAEFNRRNTEASLLAPAVIPPNPLPRPVGRVRKPPAGNDDE